MVLTHNDSIRMSKQIESLIAWADAADAKIKKLEELLGNSAPIENLPSEEKTAPEPVVEETKTFSFDFKPKEVTTEEVKVEAKKAPKPSKSKKIS